jgi:hypothetical protein
MGELRAVRAALRARHASGGGGAGAGEAGGQRQLDKLMSRAMKAVPAGYTQHLKGYIKVGTVTWTKTSSLCVCHCISHLRVTRCLFVTECLCDKDSSVACVTRCLCDLDYNSSACVTECLYDTQWSYHV